MDYGEALKRAGEIVSVKKLKVLILGSGGREHALCFAISKSPMLSELFVLPGNPGIAKSLNVKLVSGNANDVDLVLSVAKKYEIDLVVVGPEDPLANGVSDVLNKSGIKVYGPDQYAAQLESSKAFSKDFMIKNKIKTAKYVTVHNFEEARSAILNWDKSSQIVVKASALAQGKGVIVSQSHEEALEACRSFFLDPECTVKTDKIVLEEFLKGEEVSAFAICDGTNYFYLGHACDYKRVFDQDKGPNTGGMGGYTPKDWPTTKAVQELNSIVLKVMQGMKNEGHPYVGTLFIGAMVDGDNVSVIEFNVRLGDPETQMLLPRIEGDLLEIFYQSALGDLTKLKSPPRLNSQVSVHVVMTSGGYPKTDKSPMSLGHKINLDSDFFNAKDNFIFFSGVKSNDSGELLNSGGRVLGVTAMADSIREARDKAYKLINVINFKDAHFRKDIALYERGNTR